MQIKSTKYVTLVLVLGTCSQALAAAPAAVECLEDADDLNVKTIARQSTTSWAYFDGKRVAEITADCCPVTAEQFVTMHGYHSWDDAGALAISILDIAGDCYQEWFSGDQPNGEDQAEGDGSPVSGPKDRIARDTHRRPFTSSDCDGLVIVP